MTEQHARNRILEAAATMFAQKGFARTSMNDIVRASGLSKGGVYWHFKSKDAIIQVIFEQFFDPQLDVLKQVVAEKRPAADRLRRLVELLGEASETWVTQFPFPMEFYALAARNQELLQLMVGYFDAYRMELTVLVNQGIESGEFRKVDPATTTTTLMCLFEGTLLLWAMNPDGFGFSEQISAATCLLLEGIMP